METFMGRKAFRKAGVDYTLLGLLIFSIAIEIPLAKEAVIKNDSPWANFVLLALFIWPSVNIIRGRIRAKKAKQYAFAISQNRDAAVTIGELRQAYSASSGKLLTEPQIEKDIVNLLAKNYLGNISYDVATKNVILHVVRDGGPQTRAVVCPSCGTTNTVIMGDNLKAGQLVQCQACGNPINF
jgi:hypothetical protein